MIVSEKNVSDALTYLAQGGPAEAQAAYLAAKRRRERRAAEVFLNVKGGVEERKMRVLVDNEHGDLQATEDGAEVEFVRAKSRAKGAEEMIGVWRTEKASHREAERIR